MTSVRFRDLPACLLAVAALLDCAGPPATPVYKKADAPVEERVRDLLSRMTPEEKFWQLFMLSTRLDGSLPRYAHGAFGFQLGASGGQGRSAARANAIQRHFVEETRLGIPVILFDEAVHGLVQEDAVVFPQAIALAATFDTSLVHRVSAAIARECRRQGVRQVLSPVVNVAGDVRWGRVEETYGEDPHLTSEMGVAFVSEFEKLGVITTPKHFIANVGDGGRDSYPIQFSERLLREVHLPPFSACVLRGGSRSIMTSYNSLDGTPCTANAWLVDRLLKGELGFPGFVVSDSGAVGGANVLHRTAKDYADATERALRGGLDVIFQTSYEQFPLFFRAVQEGRIDRETIDRAVSRVLRAKFELGLFEKPYVDEAQALPSAGEESHIRLAREAARESVVLLKNERGILPLRKSIGTIAVLGPDADEARLGGYSGKGLRRVSILEGIRNAIGGSARVVHARGCDRGHAEYVAVPGEFLSSGPDGASQPGLVGEYFDNIGLSGSPVVTRVDPELRFRWTLESPDPQRLPRDCYSVRWKGRLRVPASGRFKIGLEGNDGFRLYIDGEPVVDSWRKVSGRAVLAERDFLEDKEYGIRVEFFEPAGGGSIRLVWNVGVPSGGQAEMDEAVTLARQSDAAVVAVGIEEGEFSDRARLGLPGRQAELIRRVAGTGKPVVVVLVGGSAVTMGGWLDEVPAVLDVWYPGEQGGNAIADVLFGDYDPAGRLPITFPVEEGQLPLIYDHKPTGRGDDYGDLTGQPLFPFGFGLSYTSFEYSDLTFDRQRVAPGDSTAVRFKIRNAGSREGDEVVQLYVHDEVASVARPVTELKGFQRVRLEPGETREVSFTLAPEMLSMLDKDLRPVVEPGEFRIMIGASSRDIRLRGILTVGG